MILARAGSESSAPQWRPGRDSGRGWWWWLPRDPGRRAATSAVLSAPALSHHHPDSLIETSSCPCLLFSTSEAESEPSVWSLNKLELYCQRRRGAPVEREWRSGASLPGAWRCRSFGLEMPGCRPRTLRMFKGCLMK